MLYLIQVETGYAILHTDEDAIEILDLFGTDTLPTGFTPQADPKEVFEILSKTNPGLIDFTVPRKL